MFGMQKLQLYALIGAAFVLGLIGIYSTGVVQNIDILKNCSNQGIAVAPTEVDNLVRRVPLMMKTPDGFGDPDRFTT